MKIKTKSVWIYAAAVMMATASCTKDDAPVVVDNTLRFVAGLVPQTMAPIESGDDGLVTETVSGIQLLQGAYGSTPAFNKVGSVTRTADLLSSGILSFHPPQTPIEINTDGSVANFLAFYPAGTMDWTSDPNKLTVTYVIDGQTDIIAANRVSKTFSSSDDRVNLAFSHQLARLRFRCICINDANGALYQGVTEAKIKVPKSVVMNISDNGIIETVVDPSLDLNSEASYTELDFGPCEISKAGEYSERDLMIHPNAGDDKTILHMEIGLKFAGFPDDAIKTYSLTNLALVAGKTTTITATVSGATSLNISTEITAWNKVDTGDKWTIE